jgi:hypothetical protein
MRPEVWMARYVEALERHRSGRLSCIEAAEVLGISERHSVGCATGTRRREPRA